MQHLSYVKSIEGEHKVEAIEYNSLMNPYGDKW